MASSSAIAQQVAATAAQLGIPPQLAVAQATKESGLNQAAYNAQSGATGVMQLEPATAAQLGVNPQDATENIQGGLTYLTQLYNEFGDWATALAAYDWGPGNVSKAIAANPQNWLATAPAETQNYVSTILANAGMDYTVQPTADDSSADTYVAPADTSNLWILLAGGVAVYFLARLLFED